MRCSTKLPISTWKGKIKNMLDVIAVSNGEKRRVSVCHSALSETGGEAVYQASLHTLNPPQAGMHPLI